MIKTICIEKYKDTPQSMVMDTPHYETTEI